MKKDDVSKLLEFKKYSLPEMYPAFLLTIGRRTFKNFEINNFEFFVLIAVYILEQKYGMALSTKLRKLTKTYKQNLFVKLRGLEAMDYIERVYISETRVVFKTTKKGRDVFEAYQKKYRETILDLREMGIKFEEL